MISITIILKCFLYYDGRVNFVGMWLSGGWGMEPPVYVINLIAT